MNNIFTYAIALVLCTAIVNGQSIARVQNIDIHSEALNQDREILIYTPVDYDYRSNEYFNVIYVFDSQSREFFDYASSIISFLTDGSKSYIVVGIASPYNETLDYSRNNDLLPELTTDRDKERYGKYSGNAPNFLKYVHTEVVPYINDHYRTLGSNIAIGHSLSASFILYAMMENPDIFNSYIAISPNFAYDENQLANDLIAFDYSKITKPTYLYLSHANEGIDYWKEWKPAREKVYSFFDEDSEHSLLMVEKGAFPENNHWNAFPPSLNKAISYYFENIYELQEKQLGDKIYDVTIKAKVPNEDDVIFITGNQEALGDWSPNEIKMEKISSTERQIRLKLKSPVQFKFTRGNWETEAIANSYGAITIKPEDESVFEFVIEGYYDRQ